MEYVEAYNQMVTKLNDEVLKQQAEMQQTPAIED
jgi:flagellar capping protein FliD